MTAIAHGALGEQKIATSEIVGVFLVHFSRIQSSASPVITFGNCDLRLVRQ